MALEEVGACASQGHVTQPGDQDGLLWTHAPTTALTSSGCTDIPRRQEDLSSEGAVDWGRAA